MARRPDRGTKGFAAAALALAILAACAEPVGPRWVDALEATADSVHLAPGESVVFQVRALDQHGDEMPEHWVPRVEWSLRSGGGSAALDTLETGVSVTAETPGTVIVRAELGRGVEEIPVHVRPPELDHVRIEPERLTVSAASNRVVPVATARFFDAAGRELAPSLDYRISWAVVDAPLARLEPGPPWETRLFGTAGGETQLLLVVNGLTAVADLLVLDVPLPLPAPEVTPSGVTPTSLRISWRQEPGASSYRLHRSETSGAGFVHVATTGHGGPRGSQDTVTIDGGLEPGATYYYVVQACNSHGCSDPSPEGSGTVPAPASASRPPAPPGSEGRARAHGR